MEARRCRTMGTRNLISNKKTRQILQLVGHVFLQSSLHSQYVWLFLISLLELLNTCRLPPLVHHHITLPIHHVVEIDHLLHHSGT